HGFAVVIPEICWEFSHATVEQIGVLKYLVIEIVFSRYSDGAGLDSDIDVLADQDDRSFRILFLKIPDYSKDLVVCFPASQHGELYIYGVRLKEQSATDMFISIDRKRTAVFKAAGVLLTDNLFQVAARLTCVASDFRHPFLIVVQLL